MSIEIIKYSVYKKAVNGKKYCPVLAVINRKVYTLMPGEDIQKCWKEYLKILLYSCCYKPGKMDKINQDIGQPISDSQRSFIIKKHVNNSESRHYARFAPSLSIYTFKNSANNYILLKRIRRYVDDLELYVARYDTDDDLKNIKNLIKEKRNEVLEKNLKYKKGSLKRLLSRINGAILNENEQFYYRVEHEFNTRILIGDIDISEKEEDILKEYMRNALDAVLDGKKLYYEKVFAFGLVRVALKYYSNKTFWPYLKKEYNVSIPQPMQSRINYLFKDILTRNNKIYDSETTNYIQNYCMHAFICDQCADQLFDYIFDFWRVDLARSIENSKQDDGTDLFDILIDEIATNEVSSVNNIMIHTTMALKLNPKGCKMRLRRILKMIDESYWDSKDYSGSRNRISRLFEAWKNNKNSAFAKEFYRTQQDRRRGRGERLLSRPTIECDPRFYTFRLMLPKQLLRHCTEEEYPEWSIRISDRIVSTYPELLKGKNFLYTEPTSVSLERNEIFKRITVILQSEKNRYYRMEFKPSNVLFFNSKFRNIDSSAGYLSRDTRLIMFRGDNTVEYLNHERPDVQYIDSEISTCTIEPEDGDVLILPDGHAVSIGRPIREGFLRRHISTDAYALKDDREYEVAAEVGKLFFKATRERKNGTKIIIQKEGTDERVVRMDEQNCTEFKLDDSVEDVYGYTFNTDRYVSEDGLYSIKLDIPGYSLRVYELCYINGFSYKFEDAPYVFAISGCISVPDKLAFHSREWVGVGTRKRLVFSLFDDTENHPNQYVKNHKLELKYRLDNQLIPIRFNIPALYWKTSNSDTWMIEKPSPVFLKNVPERIYIDGGLSLANAQLLLKEDDDTEEYSAGVTHNVEKNLYYFRTVDITGNLTRDYDYKDVYIRVENVVKPFVRINCRSIVRDRSITGDFNNNCVHGHYDIYGDSEYTISLYDGKELIEEDIALSRNGDFSTNFELHEGVFKAVLFELHEDDTGFGSISYELDSYDFILFDMTNITGCSLEIQSIQDIDERVEKLDLRPGYTITNLKKLNYDSEVLELKDSIFLWRYTELSPEFIYYTGILRLDHRHGGKGIISEVLVIFDEPTNMSEAIVLTETDGEYQSLLFDVRTRSLLSDDGTKSNQYRIQWIRTIDDDLFKTEVTIKE